MSSMMARPLGTLKAANPNCAATAACETVAPKEGLIVDLGKLTPEVEPRRDDVGNVVLMRAADAEQVLKEPGEPRAVDLAHAGW